MKISAGWGKENQRVCYENICRLGKGKSTCLLWKYLPAGERKINVYAMKISADWEKVKIQNNLKFPYIGTLTRKKQYARLCRVRKE